MTTLCLQDFTPTNEKEYFKAQADAQKYARLNWRSNELLGAQGRLGGAPIGGLGDYETARRQEWIKSIPTPLSGYPPELEVKRQAALEYLGTRWLLHPRSSLVWTHP